MRPKRYGVTLLVDRNKPEETMYYSNVHEVKEGHNFVRLLRDSGVSVWIHNRCIDELQIESEGYPDEYSDEPQLDSL